MKISLFLHELRRRNPLLYGVGYGYLILFALLLVLFFVDQRSVLGINTWIKPMKFALSIAIYLWTFGWYLYYLPNSGRTIKVISWGIVISMLVEILCIVVQASRGVRSHFNFDSASDALIFAFMGIFITINTLFILYTFILFLLKKPDLHPAYLLSLRLGLLIFILASAVGGIIIGHGAHTIGPADGGAGLPFVNWSREGGDLRIAHFIGMHALQVIPFLGHRFSQGAFSSMIKPRLAVIITAFIYTGLFAFLFLQAMSGLPLI